MGGGGSGRSSRLRRGRCRGSRLTVAKGGGWARLGLVVGLLLWWCFGVEGGVREKDWMLGERDGISLIKE